jgi:tRNA pseudouridine32 synthase/23S rRNA pseudouridine746 synthase/23S rRNA pseudouridine1911/1915/1917 synthase
MKKSKVPKKYQPEGFEILYEDQDVIVGSKTAGFLTVAALWEKDNTIHHILNSYVRKGSQHSKKCVYVVHRLDQATSGVLMFAKSQEAQVFLKDNWKSTEKTYFAIVHGNMKKKAGLISSYLSEDEDYVVHSTADSEKGKLAQTEYAVVKETPHFSVVKIKLLTGKKNQIRVHMADEGHPVVGDAKYGPDKAGKIKNMMLHSYSLVFTHPFNKKRIRVQANIPGYFTRLVHFAD